MSQNQDRVTHRPPTNSWDGAFEGLEARVLLSGDDGVPQTEMFTWHGFEVEVVPDQWLITFDQRLGHDQARARTAEVAAVLGVATTSIESIGRGRWATFTTDGRVTEQAVQNALRDLDFLMGIEPDTVAYPALAPNDTQLGEQYAINNTGQFIQGLGLGLAGADMDLFAAWDLTTGSRQVVVAVIDTGIDLTHPDLVDNLWTNPGEIAGNGIDDDGNGFVDDVHGWDFGDNDADPQDPVDQGHGTAVAGCIGAVGNNGLGVVGVNWNVRIITAKLATAQGALPSSAQVGAHDYLTMMITDFGVNIVASNNSYGGLRPQGFEFFDTAVEIAIQSFTDAGALFIAAAGNDTNDNDGTLGSYPDGYPNEFIVAVAATNNRDEITGFSNFGLTTVDVGAPGERILTTAVGGGYEYIDGTSFSSPFTAGIIALMKAANPFADKVQLRDALLNSVDPVPGLNGITDTGGRVNAAQAVRLIGFPGPFVTAISPSEISGPVSAISIGFSETIDPAHFDLDAVEIRRANGDGAFNSNDIDLIAEFGLDASSIVLSGPSLIITFPVSLPLDQYRLTLAHTAFRDAEGNLLNGDTSGGNDETYEFTIVAGSGPLEPNDITGQATPVVLNAAGNAAFTNLVLGDGANTGLDVDLYRLVLPGPSLVTARIDARSLFAGSTLDSFLRLFNNAGVELARNDNFNGLDSRLQFFVPNGGLYYIGVSGFGNDTYSPTTEGSGTPGGSTGIYNIDITASTAASDIVIYSSTAPPLPLPTSGTVSSTIFIPDVRRVQDANVRVRIDHNFVGDLQLRLISPGGTVVPLALNRGGAGDDYGTASASTVFDDSATTAIAAGSPPFVGSFKPESVLSAFNLEAAVGTWTLQISDTAPLNAGTLLGWSVELRLENRVAGLFEVNDTLATATDIGITGSGTSTFEARIGDGPFGARDVDIYRLIADAGTTVNAGVGVPSFTANGAPNTIDTVLRLFDSQGNELLIDNRPDGPGANLSFSVQIPGVYYLGVSGSPNTAYNPGNGGTGSAVNATGDYALQVALVNGISDGAVVLDGSRIRLGLNADGSLGVASGGQRVGLSLGGVDFLVANALVGGAESYFGAIFNGFIFRNAGPAGGSDLPVSLSNESDFSNRRAVIDGLFRTAVMSDDQGGGLLVRRSLSFAHDDEFIAVDVNLVNTTIVPMDGVAWLEGFNPLQGLNLGSPFSRTFNNVDNATGRLVTATYADMDYPGGLTIGIGAPAPAGDTSVFTSVEAPGTVRDPFQIIGSVNDPDPMGDSGAEGDQSINVAYDVGTLGPGGSVSFRYFIFVGRSLAEVRAAFAAVETGAGTDHQVADPTDPAIPFGDLPYAVYHPEGYANNRASTFIPLVNPNDAGARVVIVARYESGERDQVLFDSAVDSAGGVVAPNTRTGLTLTTPTLYAAGSATHVASEIAGRLGLRKDTPYSIEIRSSAPVGATLSHFDFNIATGETFTTTASDTWTFGEGFKGQGVNDFLVFYNTTDEAVKVDLTVYHEQTEQIFFFTQEVGAFRRGGWDLASTAVIPDGPFGLKLTAQGPVVAALTHFDSNIGGGFGVVGLPSLGSLSGVTPEGQLGQNSDQEFITVLNAGDEDAAVTFTFYFENGSAFRSGINVPSGRRSGLIVSQLPGFPIGSQRYAVGYGSTAPVSVILPTFAFGEASGSLFSDQAYTLWLFSEGFRPASGSGVTEYLRLFNPTTSDVTVEITLEFAPNPAAGDAGGSETFRRILDARAATEFDLHDFITGARSTRDTFYSVRVKAASPIVAYAGHFDDFLGGGFGTLGTPMGIAAPVI